MTTPAKTVEFGPFTMGMNNRLSDMALSKLKEKRLRSIVNTDLTSDGTMRRRQGYAQALAGSDCHSLWSDGDRAFFVDGTTLYSLSGEADALTKTQVRTGFAPGRRLSYVNVNGDVIYTDQSVLRKITDGVDGPLTMPLIQPEPVVAAGGSGALDAGVYQVCFTYYDADLRQSGATTPQQVTVAAGQGIQITGLPAAFPTGVDGIMVYMTPANGDQLMLALALSAAQTTLSIVTPPLLGGRCQTLLMAPMPAGEIVRYNNGRLMVALGRFLIYSDPYSLALHRPMRNFIHFADDVTVVETVPAGTFVATEKMTYFFGGDIATAEAKEVFPYGGVQGTGGPTPDSSRCFWMSARGMIVGNSDGSAKNVTEADIAMNRAVVGATSYRERDGIKQMIASLFSTQQTGAAAYSFMDAEIIRKGESL